MLKYRHFDLGEIENFLVVFSGKGEGFSSLENTIDIAIYNIVSQSLMWHLQVKDTNLCEIISTTLWAKLNVKLEIGICLPCPSF